MKTSFWKFGDFLISNRLCQQLLQLPRQVGTSDFNDLEADYCLVFRQLLVKVTKFNYFPQKRLPILNKYFQPHANYFHVSIKYSDSLRKKTNLYIKAF